jgi:hypothetical protein
MTLAKALAEQDRYLARAEAVARLPLGQRAAAARQLTTEFERKSILHALLIPQLGQAWYTLAANAMDYRLAQVSVALARHHAETGEYPATLEGLIPKYLPGVPDDAYGGAPFTYSRIEGGVRIASQTRDPEFEEGIDMPGRAFNAEGFHEWQVRRK